MDMTLSTASCSSVVDGSSFIDEDLMGTPVPSTPSAESTPKRSGTHNLRRDGYSEERCRYVLVKYCSSIPRNFNYAEGVQLVYEKLREHCGDENLDLSIGVLYEFIEVDTQFTFEQGAAFRHWQFDHFHRSRDLTNNHAPRMGNIVVGRIIPTERLRQWRDQNPERQRGMRLSDSGAVTQRFGIRDRSPWHIENTLYVSSHREGTRVLYCPTPKEVHERTWDPSYGRGTKFTTRVHEAPDEQMDFQEPEGTKLPNRKRALQMLYQTFAGNFAGLSKIHLPLERFNSPFFLHIKSECILGRRGKFPSPKDAALDEVANLPEQDSQEGKSYYRNIKTAGLPDGVGIPNAMFARKHHLKREADGALLSACTNQMLSVEDLAIQKCLEASYETTTCGKRWSFHGPMTASLFKDSGVDYQWDVSTAPASTSRQRLGYDVGFSGNSYYSLHSERSGEAAYLRIPPTPARSQRARSQSKRALEGSDDIVQHDSVRVEVDTSYNDANRPYAFWRRSGTEAHLFSGKIIPETEAECPSSVGYFNRFATQLQNRFRNPKSKARKRKAPESPNDQPVGRARKRTAESVHARKRLLKKIFNSGGARDEDADANEVVAEDEQVNHQGPFATLAGAQDEDENRVLRGQVNRHRKIATFDGAQDEDEDEVVLEKGVNHYRPILTIAGAQGEDYDEAMVKKEEVNHQCPIVAPTTIVMSRSKNNENNNNNNNSSSSSSSSSSSGGGGGGGGSTTKYLAIRHRALLPTSILRSPFIQRLSLAPDYSIFSAFANKIGQFRMAPRRRAATDDIQVDGVFMLGSPQPLTIRKLHKELTQTAEQGQSSQNQTAALESSREMPREQHNANRFPPRTSSHLKEESAVEQPRRHRRANTDLTATQMPPNFNARPNDGGDADRAYASKRMQEINARFQPTAQNPYEFEPSPDTGRITRLTDFMVENNADDGVSDNASHQHVPGHAFATRKDSGSLPERKAPAHVKNSYETYNIIHHQRKPVITGQERGKYISHRAEVQRVSDLQYGLSRSQSSPAIGVFANSAPNAELDSAATYRNYDDGDEESRLQDEDSGFPNRDYGRGDPGRQGSDYRGQGSDNRDTDSHFPSGTTCPPDEYTASLSRGLQGNVRGLGIGSVQAGDPRENQDEGIQPLTVPRSRARSPIKKLFGPGGYLGNSGAPNSPADPQYVKQKAKPNMLAKFIAEIPRSLSPMKNVRNPFKAEEKTPVKSTFAISLSPNRQARLYMEVEPLVCRITNDFIMEQFRAGRVKTENLKKVTDHWRSKGRPLVIEFQYDQLTQRDLIVHCQRDFEFHGSKANDPIQVNGMLYSWKHNARDMSVRTFCTPDSVIQKQLHDTYKVLELLGASTADFLILQSVHQRFRRYQDEAMNRLNNANDGVKKQGQDNSSIMSPEQPLYFEQASVRGRSDLAKLQQVTPSHAPDASELNNTRYPHGGATKYDTSASRTVNENHRHDSHSHQYGALEGYQQPSRPELDRHFPGRGRPRAATQSADQQQYHDTNQYKPQAIDSRSQRGHYDSKMSHSTQTTGSRTQRNYHDSNTSFFSHGSGLRNNQQDRDVGGSSFQRLQPQDRNMNASKQQINDARAPRGYQDSVNLNTSRAGETRAANNNNRDNINSRRGDVSPIAKSTEYARARRAVEDESDDDGDDAEFLGSFSKYGSGLQ